MGLVVLTCPDCNGLGAILDEVRPSSAQTCFACDGTGGILVHTGSIGVKLPYPDQQELFKPSETFSREDHFFRPETSDGVLVKDWARDARINVIKDG